MFSSQDGFPSATPVANEPAMHRAQSKGGTMLGWTLIFLVIAVVAAVLGFGGIAGLAASIAQILFFIFIVLFVIGLVLHLVRGRRPPL